MDCHGQQQCERAPRNGTDTANPQVSGHVPTDAAYGSKPRIAASTPLTRRSHRTGFIPGPHATVGVFQRPAGWASSAAAP
ncbi:hypothetical protein [Streptomyces ossamyceticus]|uniref:hypothetical protein n=1 Tax=Streptomyces ossamyceticus TaxID=249581 RepID=UPI000A663718|nr:hypothetical protein [Streptomyces ossamyceticus]